MDLNTKQIGNITEVESMLSFLKLGYNVLQPYGDCEKYDYVVDIKNKFYKIQCKTSSTDDNGKTFKFSCRSSHKKKGKNINTHYSSKDVDYFCTTWDGKTYLVPISECETACSKRLRIEKPKNNQIANIIYADDYKIEKIINTL